MTQPLIHFAPHCVNVFVSGYPTPLQASTHLEDQGQMAPPWEAFSNFHGQRSFSLFSVQAVPLTLFIYL